MIIVGHLERRKDLLRSLTERTIRARYQQSALGGLWIIVQPVATVAGNAAAAFPIVPNGPDVPNGV